jgi:leucyl aminopeptidase
MKITYKNSGKELLKEKTLFVSVSSKNTNESILEDNAKTLYLKSDEVMTLRKLEKLVRKMVVKAKESKAKVLAFDVAHFVFPGNKISDLEFGEIIGANLVIANYEFTDYKTPPKEGFDLLNEVIILGSMNSEMKQGIEKGKMIGEEVNKTRSLANTPGGDMTPNILAQKAKEAVKGLPVKVTVLGEKEMKAKKMHTILSVGQGSTEESKFIIMEYKGGKTNQKPAVLVGKGVTFDTGGINLKPSNGLGDMHMDMSGGASVIHAIALAAKLKIKKNIIALIPSVENMASGSSYRPGDVIRSMSGKTIEVLNTDAEGRVILADALTYASQYKPAFVVDVATLTGAAISALGERANAIFSQDDNLISETQKLGERCGEYVWPLPLWEEYEDDIKGKIGDFTNIHKDDKRAGGAIMGAIFLYQFIKEANCPWLHIDMAPRMTSIEGDYLAKGATGTPVRLLLKLIEEYK